MDYWLVFFKGRNTSTVVKAASRSEAISKARKTKAAGNDQPVVSARKANQDELKDIRHGKWVRTRSTGAHPTRGARQKEAKQSISKYRPQFEKYARSRSDFINGILKDFV